MHNNEADLCSLASSKRSTPTVPIPDWGNNITSQMQPENRISNLTTSVPRENLEKVFQPSSSLAVLNLSQPQNKVPEKTVIHTPLRRVDGGQPDSLVSTPQIHLSGDVALTPTHSAFTPLSNPHSALNPLTPVPSGPHQARNSIKLQNCVSSVSLGCELKLLDIYCKTRYSEYNPARFHGVVMKILEPRATALVFRSGKIVCTGARTEQDSYAAARKFARIIHKLGFPVKFLDFKIQNFIATADLRFPVRLEALQQAHGQFSSYEPELFPGLVYRMVRPRVVLLIFVNGKIVFTGGKSRNEISEALDIIFPILRSYRKN